MRQIPVEGAALEVHGAPLDRVSTLAGPSVELLERALDGWERFLDGLEGASGE